MLGKLAGYRFQLHQIWHTAGRLCKDDFICVNLDFCQPLCKISCELPALVEKILDRPLDWTQNEGDMQDGELAGIILYYNFEALIAANHGLDITSNLPLSCHPIRPCLPVDSNYSTVETTLMHKLAYCSKFCLQNYIKCAVDLYVSRQSAQFFRQTTMEIFHLIWYVVHQHHRSWWGCMTGYLE